MIFHDANRAQTIHKCDNNRTSVSDPLGIWAKYSSARAYRGFIWRGLTRLPARSNLLLHFNKHQSITILHDQINFTAFATSTALSDWKTNAFVIFGNALFCR